MIAGVVHVSEATDDMGCFRVYPGTHRLGRMEGIGGMGNHEHADLKTEYPLENATVLEASPGDVLFFHYFLLHDSNQNVSDKIRKPCWCRCTPATTRWKKATSIPTPS